MRSYLNLDLLYNIDNYLFPLFYYNSESGYKVYSPMTNKEIFIWGALYFPEKGIVLYHDYKTNVCLDENLKHILKKKENFNAVERCKPFKLLKKDINFLKSNTRLQLN